MKGINSHNALTALAPVLLLTAACSRTAADKADPAASQPGVVAQATFNADSAYFYVARQVSMGPRVSGTPASDECARYIAAELTRHGADSVRMQHGRVVPYTGDKLPITNVMGAFNPSARDRVMLVAHYDSRPWADQDNDQDNRMRPVPGANDGASGVGVLLEIARQLGSKTPAVGVDMLFVDAEDYGQSAGFSNHDETWALGTQYWTAHMPYATDSMPRFALLLDMVGGQGAKFHREYYSNLHAPAIVDKVWSIAERSGYGEEFVNRDGGAVIDDHVFLNKAGIPAIDIIESKNEVTRSFPPTWHTMEDDMANINRDALKACGQTVLNTIFLEKPVK